MMLGLRDQLYFEGMKAPRAGVAGTSSQTKAARTRAGACRIRGLLHQQVPESGGVEGPLSEPARALARLFRQARDAALMAWHGSGYIEEVQHEGMLCCSVSTRAADSLKEKRSGCQWVNVAGP